MVYRRPDLVTPLMHCDCDCDKAGIDPDPEPWKPVLLSRT